MKYDPLQSNVLWAIGESTAFPPGTGRKKLGQATCDGRAEGEPAFTLAEIIIFCSNARSKDGVKNTSHPIVVFWVLQEPELVLPRFGAISNNNLKKNQFHLLSHPWSAELSRGPENR